MAECLVHLLLRPYLISKNDFIFYLVAFSSLMLMLSKTFSMFVLFYMSSKVEVHHLHVHYLFTLCRLFKILILRDVGN